MDLRALFRRTAPRVSVLGRSGVLWSAAIACSGASDERSARVPNDQLDRRVLSVEWDTVSTRCLTAPRDSIGMAIALRVDSTGIWLNDVSNGFVVRVNSMGELAHVVGRRGGGPGEFQAARDIEFGTAGRLVVLDPGNARLSYIDADGTMRRQVPIPGEIGHAEQFTPLPDGGFLLVTMRPDSPLVKLDSAGRLVSRRAIPWPGYARLQSLAGQGHTAVSRDLRYAAYGMTFGEMFFVLVDGDPVRVPASYVEVIEAPELRPQVVNGDTTYMMPLMPVAGADLAIEGNKLLVLFGGRTAERQRLVDVYLLPSGEYRYSFLLPRRVSRFAVYEGAMYTMFADPHICLQTLRPVAPFDSVLTAN